MMFHAGPASQTVAKYWTDIVYISDLIGIWSYKRD